MRKWRCRRAARRGEDTDIGERLKDSAVAGGGRVCGHSRRSDAVLRRFQRWARIPFARRDDGDVTGIGDAHAIGETVQFAAEVRDQNGRAMAGASVAWSSSNPPVAAVDASGLATAAGNGSATVRATSGAASGTATVSVEVPDTLEREALVALYNATDGPNWTNSDNWLTDAALGEWFGVTTASGRVVELTLANNGLDGTLPPELGNPEGVKAAGAGEQWPDRADPRGAGRTFQSGSNLPVLQRAVGADPSRAWRAAGARSAGRGGQFTYGLDSSRAREPAIATTAGTVRQPTRRYHTERVGWLVELKGLVLGPNASRVPLPTELGNLARLSRLALYDNLLTGSIPPGFGALTSLDHLFLNGNAGLTGALPAELTELRRLRTLRADGTDLCASSDPAFQSWLSGVLKAWLPLCREGPTAYLTQAVQSRRFPVPLVAGEQALLRAFRWPFAPTPSACRPCARRSSSTGRRCIRPRCPRAPVPSPPTWTKGCWRVRPTR